MQKTMPLPATAATAAAVLAAGLALAGCGGSATHSATAAATGGTAASASVPFPVAAGNTWNYRITTATVVLVTERLEIVGITASVQVKTWLAPNVGPVKELVNTSEGSTTSVVASEELLSFTRG